LRIATSLAVTSSTLMRLNPISSGGAAPQRVGAKPGHQNRGQDGQIVGARTRHPDQQAKTEGGAGQTGEAWWLLPPAIRMPP